MVKGLLAGLVAGGLAFSTLLTVEGIRSHDILMETLVHQVKNGKLNLDSMSSAKFRDFLSYSLNGDFPEVHEKVIAAIPASEKNSGASTARHYSRATLPHAASHSIPQSGHARALGSSNYPITPRPEVKKNHRIASIQEIHKIEITYQDTFRELLAKQILDISSADWDFLDINIQYKASRSKSDIRKYTSGASHRPFDAVIDSFFYSIGHRAMTMNAGHRSSVNHSATC